MVGNSRAKVGFEQCLETSSPPARRATVGFSSQHDGRPERNDRRAFQGFANDALARACLKSRVDIGSQLAWHRRSHEEIAATFTTVTATIINVGK